MTLRGRLTLALVAIGTAPLLLFGIVVGQALTARLDRDAVARLDAAQRATQQRLAQVLAPLRERVQGAADELGRDNRFRLALADERSPERLWLVDWASSAMRSAGLAFLQLQDSSGRILSSGHFRNEFGRQAPALQDLLAKENAVAVVDARTADGSVRSLVLATIIRARGEAFMLVGGLRFDSASVATLSSDPEIAAVLRIADAPPEAAVTARAHSLPYLDDAGGGVMKTAGLMLEQDPGRTLALKARLRNALLLAVAVTLLLALAVATALGQRIARPLAELADRTATLDLDRLDQRFASGREDELGTLERTLDKLAGRLRSSASRLRDAERAAATGDLARQVNHDIKNGLAPIRNVLRHLGQVAEQDPAALPATFLERRGTLDSSVEYLDSLARNYAKLSPSLGRGPTDLRSIIVDLAGSISATVVMVHLPETLPKVRADGVVLRRIVENLLTNAVEALEERTGTITVTGSTVGEGQERRVRVAVADTGRGMTRAELERAFDDFHTTKPNGTGLGLSVVRRLLTDVGGALRAESAPGEGSTFTIELPAA